MSCVSSKQPIKLVLKKIEYGKDKAHRVGKGHGIVGLIGSVDRHALIGIIDEITII